jgi:hypothetical protein
MDTIWPDMIEALMPAPDEAVWPDEARVLPMHLCCGALHRGLSGNSKSMHARSYVVRCQGVPSEPLEGDHAADD